MTVQAIGGDILAVSGDIAGHADCCCGGASPCVACSSGTTPPSGVLTVSGVADNSGCVNWAQFNDDWATVQDGANECLQVGDMAAATCFTSGDADGEVRVYHEAGLTNWELRAIFSDFDGSTDAEFNHDTGVATSSTYDCSTTPITDWTFVPSGSNEDYADWSGASLSWAPD